MKHLLMIGALLLITGCSDAEEAERALDNLGMANVETTGYSLFGCDDKDTWRTGFRDTNVNDRTVTGTVCSGLFKGATVRFD